MNIQVILREDVAHVGSLGDLVSVKPGFARNFLLPRGLAVVASDRQKNRVEHEKKVLESRVAKLKKGADELKGRLDAVTLSIAKSESPSGVVESGYQSVSLPCGKSTRTFTVRGVSV